MRISMWIVLAACTGGGHPIAIGPPPPPMTRGVLVGPLCHDGHCACRDAGKPGDGGAGLPTDGRKRFELKLASAQELWVTLPDTTIYKSPEKAEECFYIDLPSGDQPLELRASNKDGVSAELTIRELGTKTASWYDTFKFSCGHPGVCSFQELDDAKAHYEGVPKRGVFDACGSVKVKGLIWDHGKAPDMQHPNDLVVRLTLGIYKYAPWQPHGEDCAHKGKPPKDAGPDVPSDNEP
jgi:hypothetical protein